MGLLNNHLDLIAKPVGTRAAMRDALFRVMSRQRQRRLIAADPLALEPRVDPHARTLGFRHVYVARELGETTRWLTSAVYAGAAANPDPTDLCHLAFDQFHTFLETGDGVAREDFVGSVRELHLAGRSVKISGRECFIIPNYGQPQGYTSQANPWLNAMVQGFAGSLFARAYQLTGDERFVTAAVRSIGVFFVPVSRGGVRDAERGGRVFYEKCAIPGQSRHILNGFMYSLLGIWDVGRATGDADALRAFEQGFESLDDTVLSTYDNGHTTLYDQRSDRRATPSSTFYTWVHARQLAALGRITGQRRLGGWAERWREYTRRIRHRARTTVECLGYRARNMPRYLWLKRADS